MKRERSGYAKEFSWNVKGRRRERGFAGRGSEGGCWVLTAPCRACWLQVFSAGCRLKSDCRRRSEFGMTQQRVVRNMLCLEGKWQHFFSTIPSMRFDSSVPPIEDFFISADNDNRPIWDCLYMPINDILPIETLSADRDYICRYESISAKINAYQRIQVQHFLADMILFWPK